MWVVFSSAMFNNFDVNRTLTLNCILSLFSEGAKVSISTHHNKPGKIYIGLKTSVIFPKQSSKTLWSSQTKCLRKRNYCYWLGNIISIYLRIILETHTFCILLSVLFILYFFALYYRCICCYFIVSKVRPLLVWRVHCVQCGAAISSTSVNYTAGWDLKLKV